MALAALVPRFRLQSPALQNEIVVLVRFLVALTTREGWNTREWRQMSRIIASVPAGKMNYGSLLVRKNQIVEEGTWGKNVDFTDRMNEFSRILKNQDLLENHFDVRS